MKLLQSLIAEKDMGAKAFSNTEKRFSSTAKVGFEFESVVTTDSPFYDYEKSTPASIGLRKLNDLDDFENYFSMSKSDVRRVDQDYTSWMENKKSEWIDDNWESYLDSDIEDEDEREEDARSKAADEYPEDDEEFTDWMKDQHGGRYGFITSYGIDPIYGWESEDEEDSFVFTEPSQEESNEYFTSATNAAESLKELVGAPVIVRTNYHEAVKLPEYWYIEPDGSIDSPSGPGIEIVSPPMELSIAMSMMKNIFKWMDDNSIETNNSTGLHINLSIPNLQQKLDPVKLVLFMGDKYAAKVFNREKNVYTKSQFDAMVNSIKMSKTIPEANFDDMKEVAREALSDQKHSSVNLRHLPEGYLEFRVAGGEDYHKTPGEVRNAILRFVTAIETACDPEMDKQEYLKKLSKLFSKVSDAVQSIDDPRVDKYPEEIRRIIKLDQETLIPILRNIDVARFPENKTKSVVQLLAKAATAVRKMKTSFTPKEVVYLKQLAKKNDVKKQDILDMWADGEGDTFANRIIQLYGIT